MRRTDKKVEVAATGPNWESLSGTGPGIDQLWTSVSTGGRRVPPMSRGSGGGTETTVSGSWADYGVPIGTDRSRRATAHSGSRRIKQLLAIHQVLGDGVVVERETESRLLGDGDVAVLDDRLLDEVLPPAEFVGVVLHRQ